MYSASKNKPTGESLFPSLTNDSRGPDESCEYCNIWHHSLRTQSLGCKRHVSLAFFPCFLHVLALSIVILGMKSENQSQGPELRESWRSSKNALRLNQGYQSSIKSMYRCGLIGALACLLGSLDVVPGFSVDENLHKLFSFLSICGGFVGVAATLGMFIRTIDERIAYVMSCQRRD